MEIDPGRLPNDPVALRQMVVGLLEQAAEQERELRQLQHWVEQLLRARYGPKRERVDENQLLLARFQPLADLFPDPVQCFLALRALPLVFPEIINHPLALEGFRQPLAAMPPTTGHRLRLRRFAFA